MLNNYEQELKQTGKISDEKLLELRDELKTYRDEAQRLLDQVNGEFTTRIEKSGKDFLIVSSRKVKLVTVNLFNQVKKVIELRDAVKEYTKKLQDRVDSGETVRGMTSYTKIDVR